MSTKVDAVEFNTAGPNAPAEYQGWYWEINEDGEQHGPHLTLKEAVFDFLNAVTDEGVLR